LPKSVLFTSLGLVALTGATLYWILDSICEESTMTDIASAQPAPQTTAEYEAAFERLMEEAESLNEQMRRDRIEIERLKMETKIIRDANPAGWHGG